MDRLEELQLENEALRQRIAELENRIQPAESVEPQQTEKLLAAQRDLARTLSHAATEEEIWARCLAIALQLTGMDSGGIYLFDDSQSWLELVCHSGLGEEFICLAGRFPRPAVNVQGLLSGRPLFVAQHDFSLPEYARREGLATTASIPFAHQGQILGAINLASHTLADISPFVHRAVETLASEIGNIALFLKTRSRLNESSRTAQAILNATSDPVFLMHTDGRLLAANESMAARLGRPLAELIGLDLYTALPPHIAGPLRRQVESVGHARRGMRFEQVFRFTDAGEGLWIENALYPVLNGAEPVQRVVVYSRDISERQRAQEALRASEEKYRGLMESLDTLVVILDLQGVILYANDRAGQQLSQIFPAALAEQHLQSIRQAVQENRRVLFEDQNLLPGCFYISPSVK